MSSTTATTTCASAAETPIPSRQGTFARQAALAVFGSGARWALDDPDFTDRDPSQATAKAREIIAGRQRVRHWLALALRLDGEDAEAAYETAERIRKSLFLEWADVLPRAVP